MRTDAEGTYHYEPAKVRIRFLITDGTTADVVTERDDSDLRAALLDALNPGHKKGEYARTIAGDVNLGPVESPKLGL